MKKQIVLLALASLMGLTLQAQTVKTTTTKGVDLTKYETFTVVKGELMTPPDERLVSNEALFKSFRKTIVQEMELRGYKFVDSLAQLVVSYVAGAYNTTDGGAMGPLSQTPASNPSEMNQSRSWSHESRQGMLVIDIADAANKKEVWSATGTLTLDAGVELTRAVDGVIYKAFKKFPNKNKKKKK
jgi:Domain of unknown function (DUF4136)